MSSYPSLTVAQVRDLMDQTDAIRHVIFASSPDAGKSTLMDTVHSKYGIMEANFWDRFKTSRCDDIVRPRPVEDVPRTFYWTPTAYQKTSDTQGEKVAPPSSSSSGVLMHVSCAPSGRYKTEVARHDLTIADGVVLVVDCVEGVCVQTETVLRQALTERICPVLFITKVDRPLFELDVDPEEVYQGFVKAIQNVNTVIATFNDPSMGDVQVSPLKGTATFGSGLQGWAFSLDTFAKMYASKFGVDEMKMRERLWGDNFFDAKNKKWIKQETNSDGERVRRAFCQFCMDPIYQIYYAAIIGDLARLDKMLKSLNIQLNEEEREQVPKRLFRTVMRKFLPAAEPVSQMIVAHLPSPKKAQNYRAEMLYSGEPSPDDKYFMGIKNCDPTAPLMLYINNKPSIPHDPCRFFTFGRIFSGKIASGQKVRIMGNNYIYGKKQDLYDDKPVRSVVLMMGAYDYSTDQVRCGNIVGLVGVDTYIVKYATITDDGETPHPLRDTKYSVSPVVRVAVEAKNPSDLPKLVEGLKRLAKSDPLVVCSIEESGEHIVAGAGELHLEICLKDLQDDFMNGAPLKISEPVVSFRETVTAVSSQVCTATSHNNHNRLSCRGAPLTEEIVLAIEEGAAGPEADRKSLARYLVDTFAWDAQEARKIWCYGPDNRGPNVVVDATHGTESVSEMKDSIVAAWRRATREGVLCGESMRGVRINVEDVTMHADAIHRGGGQIIPTARRVFYACCLTASPRLMEPVFLVDIQTVEHAMGGIYGVLTRRRGVIIGEENRRGTPIYNVRAYLPVAESFGLMEALANVSAGSAVAHCVLDHWQLCDGDPLCHGTPANATALAIRARKGLKEELPSLAQFLH